LFRSPLYRLGGIALKTRLKTEGSNVQAQQGRNRSADRRAAGQLAEDDGGVYEDRKTGRWFIVIRPAGRSKTTTRRRAPDGRRLLTRDQALVAKGQWEAQLAGGGVAIGRERVETYWPRYLRHAY
jgi:hypothetical protein